MNNMTNQPSMNQRSSCNCQQNCNNGCSNNYTCSNNMNSSYYNNGNNNRNSNNSCSNSNSNNNCNNNRNYNNNLRNSGNSNSTLTPTRQSSCALTTDKRGLMQNIYELGFVLTEVNLYLDTHPDDLEAIEYYAQIKDKYCDYMTQYADYYGPLDKLHISNDNYWMWVATPMPWEMEGC